MKFEGKYENIENAEEKNIDKRKTETKLKGKK